MAKRLFLLLFSGLLGVIVTPGFLLAGPTEVKSSDFPATQSVTVVEESKEEKTTDEEKDDESEAKEEDSEEKTISDNTQAVSTTNRENNTASVSSAPVREEPAPVYVAPADSITIAGRTLRIVDVSDTAVDSGDHVNKYGNNFLYGHNSSAVFGNLVSMGVGSTFSITYGGVTTNYQVSKVTIFEKDVASGKLQLNGSGNYMRAVSNGKSDGVKHDFAIMTCYGTSYGNGDASHRLVLFADEI
ncbi:hypothetical protein IIY24_02185 [Candidatus Saccharibacteria bacterium]|nr:hypothetical protein [Candidatus Saccharibacteria bacterium]